MLTKIERSRRSSNMNLFEFIVSKVTNYIEDLDIEVDSYRESATETRLYQSFMTNKGNISLVRKFNKSGRDQYYAIKLNDDIAEVNVCHIKLGIESDFIDISNDLKSLYYDTHISDEDYMINEYDEDTEID